MYSKSSLNWLVAHVHTDHAILNRQALTFCKQV